MSYAAAVYDLLAASDELTAIVTVLSYREIPGGALNRKTVPEAYHENGLLKPNVVVKGRGNIPDGAVRDTEEQTVSTRQVIELWFHDDRDAGYDTILEAADICYDLLEEQRVPGSFNIRLVNEIDEERLPDLGDACFARRDYLVVGLKAPSPPDP